MTARCSEIFPEHTLDLLISQYYTPILRLCCVILRDPAAAEDAAQETFFKAYRGIGRFRRESSEKTWLTSIAMNVCRDMCKSAWWRHNDRRYTPEDMEGKTSAFAGNEPGEFLDLGRAIADLPEKYRDAVLLYYYHDMTLEEAAKVLKTTPSTISKRLARARALLKTALEAT